ncbi:MAG TPA: CAP domain-containing protein [Pedococcus sp.]|jgi:uncharacterized protein YkwD|uniref:CAP domain-containing protein n=1 Tax=Pedococcus sp. TaxID=2860345 RepID=UPI002F91D195
MRTTTTSTALVAAAILTTANTCGPGTASVPAQDLLAQINAKRAAVGCQAVSGNDQLRAAAERHAVDMRDNPAVRTDPNHKGSDGSTPQQRIAEAGYAPASRTGEIMYFALGPPGNSVQANVDWWMNSPPHRALIEDCSFTHAGVGLLYPGGTQWFSVIDFGAH